MSGSRVSLCPPEALGNLGLKVSLTSPDWSITTIAQACKSDRVGLECYTMSVLLKYIDLF